ncbi:MAG: pyridoxamine 5'-phosphate oxidase family protein [Dehalococcoidia bacterium]
MDVASFDEIAGELHARTSRIIWCTFATVDRRGRPRSRILHPIWEGPVCWAATNRRSFKGKHIANNPYVSLTYWDAEQQQIYADCRAEWEDDPAERKRIWELYKSTPPPVGYDLALFFGSGPEEPNYGLLKLTPWRIELWSLPDMMRGIPNKVWRGPG